jgi:proline iminopeptidase
MEDAMSVRGRGDQPTRLAIDSAGHEIAFWEWGEGEEVLLGLHGGPGLDHRYIERLSRLGRDGLRVILYDQLGSGQSDRPDDPSLWRIERFVEEVEAVRTRLDLGRVHLFGQSWGGWLALQYALDHPEALKSLVLSNTSASIPDTFKGMVRLRADLPSDEFAIIMHAEGQGDTDDPQYTEVIERLYATHLRRSTPFGFPRTLDEYRDIAAPLLEDIGPAYRAMWGPHEFLCNGNLIDWDVTGRLSEITTPSLVLCGWYDHLVLDIQRTMADALPDSEFVIFGHSSHLTILEKEAHSYLAVIRDFVDRAGRRNS